ncbi:insulinase family protein [Bernardetia sp.]|uniref:insulinase family protein n=1 Tax=Bernardetia sp. TaxID=1937974 RepID=UPI0025C3B497|nr:insulinase family protein [Bernardetia sp.]
MKNKFILSIAFSVAFLFYACTPIPSGSTKELDRSQAPKAGEARQVEIANSKSFVLENGLQVFVVENHKLPQVSYSLVVDYDPIMEGKRVGMLDMFGSMLRRGTETRTKEQLDEEVDFMGANLITYSRGIYASSLKRHSDKLLSIFSDVLYNPSFTNEELEKVRNEALSNLQSLPSSPEQIANNVVSKVNYGNNHPYGEVETEATINAVKNEDLKDFHQTYFRPNVSYLAIVGDITLEEAKAQAKKYFGKWERKIVPQTKFDMPKAPEKPQVAISNRTGAVQTVINITYPVFYPLDSKDYVAARLMNGILGNSGFGARLIQNLREDKAYTYGAYSSLQPDELSSSFTMSASVRNEVTDSAVVEFLYELKRIKEEPVAEAELERAKASMIGSFVRSLERPQTVANFAINIARYGLPSDFYTNYIQKVNAVTVEDIQNAAKKYIKPENLTIVVVGDQSILVEKLAPFGNVQIYDAFGEMAARADQRILIGMTAEKVIQNYLKAIGGKKWNEVTAIEKAQTMTTPQGKIEQKVYIQNRQKLAFVVAERDIRQVYDGNKAYIITRGEAQELDMTQTANIKEQTFINPYAQYEKTNGYAVELLGAQVVDDKSVFEIKITHPKYGERLQYFDPKTNLLIKEVTASGEVMIGDYRKTANTQLLMPYKAKVSSPQGSYTINVESIKFNSNIDAKVFMVE